VTTEIVLPNGWTPRAYQLPLWTALERGTKRAVAVWHRRAGKDSLGINWTAAQAVQRPGVYWHLAPTQRQVRKIIWDNVDSKGRRVTAQAFPEAIRRSTHQQEMKIELKGGSIWQCVGSDNYDSLVGANPVGVVFSEYSLADPAAWNYLRPILAENDGWALFLYTPRGRNHGFRLWQMANTNEDWYCETLTVDDTHAVSEDAVQAERRAGMSEDMIQQEFFCSFSAANPGAYYGAEMQAAYAEGRVGKVPYARGTPLETWWDLGMDDSTSIWITQTVAREIRVLAYYEANSRGLEHYSDWLHAWAEERELRYERHGLPHDVDVRELGTGKSRKEVLEDELRIQPVEVAPRLPVNDGINAVRRLLPQCWFDETGCEQGLSCLMEYTKVFDERQGVFQQKPLHNWASHGADAFRTMATLHPGHGPVLTAQGRDRYQIKRARGSWMAG